MPRPEPSWIADEPVPRHHRNAGPRACRSAHGAGRRAAGARHRRAGLRSRNRGPRPRECPDADAGAAGSGDHGAAGGDAQGAAL